MDNVSEIKKSLKKWETDFFTVHDRKPNKVKLAMFAQKTAHGYSYICNVAFFSNLWKGAYLSTFLFYILLFASVIVNIFFYIFH